jgi:hypothetical protein
MTSSSIPSTADTSIKSSEPSPNQSEKVDFVLERQNLLKLNQSESPRIAWHRPTIWLTDQILDWTPMGNLHFFYSANFADTLQQTPQSNHALILRKFYSMSTSNVDKALCDFFIGAFFFAMRSCEYVSITRPRKTKLLALRNIRFFKGRHLMSHNDTLLHLADCVSITFELQKKETMNDTITQHSSSDKVLCPVKVWAKIVQRISTYPNSSKNTTVNTYVLSDNSIILFQGTELLKRLRLAADSIGSDTLGSNEIGLHSARSGAAMAMYLAGVPVFTIMLLGRWSSDAFLCYIRKQVKEFSRGVSNKIIQNESFFTIPSAFNDDPRTSNHPLNHALRNTHGLSFKETIHPLSSVFH